MGTYILILMFVLVAIAVTFATYNLSMIKSMPPEERYKLLYFKDDQVSIGIGLVRRTYNLKDIREVRFSKGKKFRSMGSWAGRMKICKKMCIRDRYKYGFSIVVDNLKVKGFWNAKDFLFICFFAAINLDE